MNTSNYIPYDSVAPILLESPDLPGMPFFSGTGFFVHFPPYDDIFFVTAKHCVLDACGKEKGVVTIPYHQNQSDREAVHFDGFFLVKASQDEEEYEDVAIYVVADVSDGKGNILKGRALPLRHQDDLDFMIERLKLGGGKLRAVGFPGTSKSIDYDEGLARVQPRGFHGTFAGDSVIGGRYKLENLNWKDGDLDGFSGSPVIEFALDAQGKISAFAIGLLTTGSGDVAHFLPMSFVTDAIAKFILEKYHPDGGGKSEN